ncbi:hypothetical protein NDA01_20000 [Trichocoleus desertorum AS-A10]|uniref:hypothetical protein n=1 Tax=Trichocoleus desertorum TaxID=1481672 RepID=UPI003296F0EF
MTPKVDCDAYTWVALCGSEAGNEHSIGPQSRKEQGKAISSQNARPVSLLDTELTDGLRKMRHELSAIAKMQHKQRIHEMWDGVIASFNP